MLARHRARFILRNLLIYLVTRSPLLELNIRRYRAYRATAIFYFWRVLDRVPFLFKFSKSVGVRSILDLADTGRKDVLLVTDYKVRAPQLASVAAQLAELPQFKGAVAIIVNNRETETAIKPLSGSVPTVNVQTFWLDQSTDIANHDMVNKVAGLLRTARDECQSAAPKDGRIDLFDAVIMELHTELINVRRLLGALEAAREGGARVIAICQDIDSRLQAICYEFLARASQRPVLALTPPGMGKRPEYGVVDLRLDPELLIDTGRFHIEKFVSGERLQPAAPVPARGDAATLALISDAVPGTHFWPAVLNVATAAKRDGRQIRALVSRASAAEALRAVGVPVEVSAPARGQVPGPGFAASYHEFLAMLEHVVHGVRKMAEPAEQILIDYFTARTTQPFSIDRLIYTAYRNCEDLRGWIASQGIGAVVVLPHWSRLGWAAINAAHAQGVPSASTPAVSVAGNSASIVGWEGLDLIGCYGTQCQDAFRALGYREDQLELIGSVSLDHALALSRQAARGRLKPFGAMAADGRRIVLFATSGVNTNEREIVEALVEMCRDPSARAGLIVRPHHTIGPKFYVDALAGVEGEIARVVREGTASEAIAAADVVITDFSTIGAEAVFIRRPLLVVNMTGAPFSANNYANLGVAVQASAVGEIAPRLRRVLDEGNYWPNAAESLDAFTRTHNWGGDGNASGRFLACLAKRAAAAGSTVPLAVKPAIPLADQRPVQLVSDAPRFYRIGIGGFYPADASAPSLASRRAGMQQLIARYGLAGKSVLSVGAGRGFPEYWLAKAGCRLLLLDEDAERTLEPHLCRTGTPIANLSERSTLAYAIAPADRGPLGLEPRFDAIILHEEVPATPPPGAEEPSCPTLQIGLAAAAVAAGGLLIVAGQGLHGSEPPELQADRASLGRAGFSPIELHLAADGSGRHMLVLVRGNAELAEDKRREIADRAALDELTLMPGEPVLAETVPIDARTFDGVRQRLSPAGSARAWRARLAASGQDPGKLGEPFVETLARLELSPKSALCLGRRAEVVAVALHGKGVPVTLEPGQVDGLAPSTLPSANAQSAALVKVALGPEQIDGKFDLICVAGLEDEQIGREAEFPPWIAEADRTDGLPIQSPPFFGGALLRLVDRVLAPSGVLVFEGRTGGADLRRYPQIMDRIESELASIGLAPVELNCVAAAPGLMLLSAVRGNRDQAASLAEAAAEQPAISLAHAYAELDCSLVLIWNAADRRLAPAPIRPREQVKRILLRGSRMLRELGSS